jgi:hypothetical protein
MARFYDNNTGEYVTYYEETLNRKVFYIHGTKSSCSRWEEWKDTVEKLNLIAQPDNKKDSVDTKFDWSQLAGWTNNLEDRRNACLLPGDKGLVNYVLNHSDGYEEIVLIGHSHGGNVAIQAADILAAKNRFKTIYLITIASPVFNKIQFSTATPITGLKLIKTEFKEIRMSPPYNSSMTIYTYLNPENPANWGKNDVPNTKRTPIKHLSIYNRYDRVDGIALFEHTILENSRMTFNTSTFEYDDLVNIELPSFQLNDERNRAKYKNHCSHLISLLVKLRYIITRAEIVLVPHMNITSKSEGQDNVYIHRESIEYECLGYRLIPELPNFKSYTLSDFLVDGCPELSQKDIESMEMKSICNLFFDGADVNNYIINFNKSLESRLLQFPPYPIRIVKGEADARSSNIERIDEKIEILRNEIEIIETFNKRTKKEHKINPYYKPFLYVLPGNLKYLGTVVNFLADGVDNHSFDTNSPEVIEAAIKTGLIKPFPRVRRKTGDESEVISDNL